MPATIRLTLRSEAEVAYMKARKRKLIVVYPPDGCLFEGGTDTIDVPMGKVPATMKAFAQFMAEEMTYWVVPP